MLFDRRRVKREQMIRTWLEAVGEDLDYVVTNAFRAAERFYKAEAKAKIGEPIQKVRDELFVGVTEAVAAERLAHRLHRHVQSLAKQFNVKVPEAPEVGKIDDQAPPATKP